MNSALALIDEKGCNGTLDLVTLPEVLNYPTLISLSRINLGVEYRQTSIKIFCFHYAFNLISMFSVICLVIAS